jgi:hypothetical protein
MNDGYYETIGFLGQKFTWYFSNDSCVVVNEATEEECEFPISKISITNDTIKIKGSHSFTILPLDN